LNGEKGMGYFANLYVVEVSTSASYIKVETSIFGAGLGQKAYFTWGPGSRSENLYSYGNGTIFSDTDLELLPGYPLLERYERSNPFLLETAFTPRNQNDPVIIHIMLPEHFVPKRDLTPFIQPCDPFIYTEGDRMIITYPAKGKAEVRFWISEIQDEESLREYDMTKIMRPEAKRSTKVELEINLGIFKIKFS
jgi:hypothetical protein